MLESINSQLPQTRMREWGFGLGLAEFVTNQICTSGLPGVALSAVFGTAFTIESRKVPAT